MNSLKVLLAIGAIGVFGVSTPAFAQRGGGGHGGGGHVSGGGHASGGRVAGGHAGGGYRGGTAVSRGSRGAIAPRGFAARGPAVTARGGPAFARSGAYVRGGYGYARGFGGRVVAPIHFVRPYYSFRPRFSLGFGIWAGYPFAYTYGFYDPFWYGPYAYAPAYPYPYPYYDPYAYPGYTPPAYPPASPAYPSAAPTYPPADQPAPAPSNQGSVGVEPNQQNMGGLSFDITPSTAQLFVDGRAAGTVGQFTTTTQPLGLPAGRHHIEVRAPGYRTLTFDVDIIAGQVIPYQGTLER